MRERERVAAPDRAARAGTAGAVAAPDVLAGPAPVQEVPLAAAAAPPVHDREFRCDHPVVLVDPRPATLVAVWSLRHHRTPLHVLSARRLEPSLWARGVHRHFLPALDLRPRAWSARLLELAAHLEPRPLLVPCSRAARCHLRAERAELAPHYTLPYLEALDLHGYEAEDFRTEQALRRTVLRGEPAFEVHAVLDASGGCLGACVLAWVAGVPPTVLVTSVEGEDVLDRSLVWLQEHRVHGYARLIWGPDRFGRIDLQAAGTIPGTSWVLAVEDGVDLPALWVASLLGIAIPPCRAQRQLSRSFAIAKPGTHDAPSPLLALRAPWSAADPLPFVAALLGSFARDSIAG